MFSLPLDIWFEIAALIVCILCYSSIRDKPLKWFIPYLLFIVVIELVGNSHRVSNSWLYIFTIPVEYFFYTFIFYLQYHNSFFKKIAKFFLFVTPLAAVINIAVLHNFYGIERNKLLGGILIAGSSEMILLCCLYFIDLFKREEEINLIYNPGFWLSTGLFFFNLGELPYNLFFDYIVNHRYDQKGKLFISIHQILNYVLYTFVSIAVLCSKKRYRKTYGSLL
jgi:hypothetical protein